MEATIHGPGRGENHVLGGSSVSVKAGSEQTAGSFYCGEVELESGFPGPPPHIHERLHDMFYVLEGVLTMRVGLEELEAPAGTFACVPPGVVHTFSNPRPERVRFLNFNTPGGWEGYMRDLAAATADGHQLTSAQVGEIASRYDFRAVTLT